MEYVYHIAVLCTIYAILAVSLDLLVGQVGLLSLAHGAFFGVGAYASALTSTVLGLPFSFSFAAALGMGTVLSLAVSIPALRLHDDYFVIATFGFQLVVVSVLNNWIDLTGGPVGVRGIPRPEFLGAEIRSGWALCLFAASFLAVTWAIVSRLTMSPFGRVLRAISEDEVLVSSLGKNIFRFKIAAVAVSAAMAAGAGSIFAHYARYIEPSGFGVMESILIVSMVIIGGAGSVRGPIVGAVVLVLLPEVLRVLGVPSHVAANLRQIIYGSALVVMMFLRPGGLVQARTGTDNLK